MTNSTMPQLHATHQAIVARFIAAGQTDARVVAAFLGGSYATGKADSHSDLDLYLITTATAYAGFLTDKEVWIRQLGEPLFLEDWGTPPLMPNTPPTHQEPHSHDLYCLTRTPRTRPCAWSKDGI